MVGVALQVLLYRSGNARWYSFRLTAGDLLHWDSSRNLVCSNFKGITSESRYRFHRAAPIEQQLVLSVQFSMEQQLQTVLWQHIGWKSCWKRRIQKLLRCWLGLSFLISHFVFSFLLPTMIIMKFWSEYGWTDETHPPMDGFIMKSLYSRSPSPSVGIAILLKQPLPRLQTLSHSLWASPWLKSLGLILVAQCSCFIDFCSNLLWIEVIKSQPSNPRRLVELTLMTMRRISKMAERKKITKRL